MRRSLGGDGRAHEELLKALAPILRSYFRRRLSARPEDVEDLVQESLFAVHTRRSTYEPSRLLLPWVFAIAKYKLIDQVRRWRRLGVTLELSETLASDDSEDTAAARLDIDSVLATLPQKQAQSIRAMQIDGDSAAAAAARHGWSESDVKVSVHRGLKALKARFAEGRA